MDNKILSFVPKIYFPGSIFWGDRSFLFLKIIQDEKKLIVVSNGFKNSNDGLLNNLFGEGVKYFIQEREPEAEDFNRLKERCLRECPVYLIAIGGGSVIDLVKLVKRDLGIKMLAIPTTIGSGAEFSQHALLIRGGEKEVQSSSDLLPEIVIVNPVCVKSLTQRQVIFQSIDALSHGLESLVSKISHPFSDSFSLRAIERIYFNLNQLAEGKEKDGILEELQVAAALAGLAQSSAATGLVHSFAHYFGAKNKISHSEAVATFLLDVLELNSKHTDKYEKLNQLKNLSSDNFISQFRDLFNKLGVKLEKIEIKEDLEKTAELIKKDICALTNPYSPAPEDIIEILKKHTNG